MEMDNQQLNPKKGKVQRLSWNGVGQSVPKWVALLKEDEDIVCTFMKIREVFSCAEVAFPHEQILRRCVLDTLPMI